MAKVDANALIAALNGAIGGLVFRRMPDGSVLVSTAPNYGGRKRKSTRKQKDHQRRFKQATMFARSAAKAFPLYAELARGTMKSPYNFALSDWFHPPVIHQVKLEGEKILVRATDNIQVSRVQVTLRDGEGTVLEKGAAARREGDWWEYTPGTAGKTITAQAWDLPGHSGTLSIMWN